MRTSIVLSFFARVSLYAKTAMPLTTSIFPRHNKNNKESYERNGTLEKTFRDRNRENWYNEFELPNQTSKK
jgi:hypothetical protein